MTTSEAAPARSEPSALHVEGLVKRYGDTVAVDGLSLDVPRGRVLALLGPNGAGKTTTVEVCEGFLRPDAGTVRVLGLDPAVDRQQVRNRIGMMLQGGGAYPAAGAREMLHLVASYYADPLDPQWLLEQLGMVEHARTPYRRLSGGQQQRLSLACAIVGRPELVFLDEPTAGLDAQARRAVWDLVRALRRDGAGVVLTTHLMDEAAALADEVVIVDRGRQVAAGTPAELSELGADEGVTVSASATLDPGALAALAADIGSDYHVVPQGTPGVTEVRGPVTPALLTALCAAYERAGVQIYSLARSARTLEEVFLDLTGRDVR